MTSDGSLIISGRREKYKNLKIWGGVHGKDTMMPGEISEEFVRLLGNFFSIYVVLGISFSGVFQM
jgi:hypothetical protein